MTEEKMQNEQQNEQELSVVNENTQKKPSKKKLWIIICSIVAALLLIGGGTAFWFLKDKIIPPKQEQATLDLIPVKLGDKWGYINQKGEYVINPQFEYADYFCDGLAAIVQSVDKKERYLYGYIDKKGKQVIKAQYKYATPFSDGLAFVVAEDGYPTCINKSGKTVFTLSQAELAYSFSEGMAQFVKFEKKLSKEKGWRGKVGFVDKTGKVVIAPQFDDARPFHEGFAAILQNDKWGFIDKAGKIVINPQFDEVGFFMNGITFFRNGTQYGFIDKQGKYVINPQFAEARYMEEQMAPIKIGDLWGYCNNDGKIVVNPQFEEARIFSDGLARIKQNERWGYIDHKGKFVINPQFSWSTGFNEGIAFVKVGDKFGVINKKGEYTINPQFDSIIPYNDTPFGLVQNDYYDMSEFLTNLDKIFGKNTFDSFSNSSTFRTLFNHSYYKDDLYRPDEYDSHNMVTYKRRALSKEIIMDSIQFHFDESTWKYVDKYEYYGRYNQYQRWAGSSKVNNYDANIDKITCTFVLSDKATLRQEKILKAIKTKIEKLYGCEMSSSNVYRSYCYINKKGLSFKLTSLKSGNISLEVYMDSEYLQWTWQRYYCEDNE